MTVLTKPLSQVDATMFEKILRPFASLIKKNSNSLSVPVLDGAFKPNNLLEEAEVLVERAGLEDLAVNDKGQLFAACGSAVFAVSSDGEMSKLASFDQDVTALAVLNDNSMVVALGDKVITGVGTSSERITKEADGIRFVAVTALSVQKDGQVLVTDGSDKYPSSDWRRDLMSKNRKGRLIRLNPKTGKAQVLASGLAYAFGAYNTKENGILVSESWTHSISQVSTQGKSSTIIEHLPGYPCRFAACDDGGFWLTLFCSRTQLVEFVLKENDYRQEMMKTIPPEYWIAPSYGSGTDFLEPLQGGGVKQMGYLKPWAPPRSYGLLVRFGSDLTPEFSLHSRVGGKHHGICAAVQVKDTLYLLSKGAGRILKLSVAATRATLSGEDIE